MCVLSAKHLFVFQLDAFMRVPQVNVCVCVHGCTSARAACTVSVVHICVFHVNTRVSDGHVCLKTSVLKRRKPQAVGMFVRARQSSTVWGLCWCNPILNHLFVLFVFARCAPWSRCSRSRGCGPRSRSWGSCRAVESAAASPRRTPCVPGPRKSQVQRPERKTSEVKSVSV